jgi:DNA-binding PadR family transcriptional regulator
MARSQHELGAGDWAVLALLAEQPTHGFAVARALAPDGEIGKVWSVRRPLVYRAIDSLSEMGFAAPTGTVPSPSGPRRTVVAATDAGRTAVDAWLVEPVGHVREARSLLMLKLLFLSRRGQDPAPLLNAQRAAFAAHAARLADAAEAADGFDEVLIRWRLESTNAAIRFIDGLLRSS